MHNEPSARKLEHVRERHPKQSLPYRNASAKSSTKGAASIWDGPTIVQRDKPASEKMLTKTELPSKRSVDDPPRAKDKAEKFPCVYPGCVRKFVHFAELQNHVAVLHQRDQDIYHDPYQQPAFDAAEERRSSYPDSGRYAAFFDSAVDGDETIKPLPITSANLNALNSDSEPDLARSMHDMSISGSEGRASSTSMISVDTTYSVLEETDGPPLSDVAEADSPSIQVPVRILLLSWRKLLVNFLNRTSPAHRQNAPYPDQSRQPGSASQSSNNLAAPSQTSSLFSGSTRSKRQRTVDDDEEDDPGRKQPKTRLSKGQMSPENRALACPFNKYDSYTFGGDARNAAYHVCSTWHDVKTAYFKQHLLRNHCIPEFHCDRCGGDYKNQAKLRDHRRQNPPCELKELDKQKIMPEVQTELGLRTRNAVATSRTAYWYKVYDAIFGNEARQRRPVEPYFVGPSHEVLGSFLHFSELRMPEVIRRSRQILRLEPEDYNEQDTQLVRTVMQEASTTFMAELRATQPQSLRDIRHQNSSGSSAVDLGDQTIIVKEEHSIGPANEHEGIQQPWQQQQQHQQIHDFQQPLNTALTHESPHAGQFTSHPQPQTYNLPTRPADPAVHPQQIAPYGYGNSTGYGYSAYTAQDFEDAPFLHESEFIATVEDPDLYGPGSLSAADLGEYEFVEPSSRRERILP